jgi:hypothetical protein
MLDSEKLGIAAHLHVLLRRRLERVTDVEWMVRNRDYAREIVRLCQASVHLDLHQWAAKLEAALVAEVPPPPPPPRPVEVARVTEPGGLESRYIGRLR